MIGLGIGLPLLRYIDLIGQAIGCLPIREGFGNAGAEVTPPAGSVLSDVGAMRVGPGIDLVIASPRRPTVTGGCGLSYQPLM